MSPILPALGRMAPALIKWLGVGSTVYFAGDAVKSVANVFTTSSGTPPAVPSAPPSPPVPGFGGLVNPATQALYQGQLVAYQNALAAREEYEAKQKRNADLYRVAMLTAVGLVAAKVIDSLTGYKRAGRK